MDKSFPNVKEVYGSVAKDYAHFRPRYPPLLFSFLSSLTPHHDLAWDVGTGTGQAAIQLSKYYARVVATDTSEAQIQHAEQRPNITYAVTPPSMSEQQLQSIIGSESSVDLVTVATAVHWFDLDKFYAQVKHVLKKPGGVIAVWAYWKPTVDPAVDAVHERFFRKFYPFSHPSWKMLVEDYETLPFPFTAVDGIKMEIEEERTCEEYLGYFRTRHALVGKEDILNEFSAEVEAAWGGPVHLVTVATAVHWFDLDKFYAQVKHVLKKPGGVIAVWAYWKPTVDPAVDAVHERFFRKFYPLHPAAKVVLEEYETLPFPFAAMEGIKVEIEEERTCEEYLGYFRTRHALVGREEILNEFSAEVEAAWGGPVHVTKAVKFPLCFKIGKV